VQFPGVTKTSSITSSTNWHSSSTRPVPTWSRESSSDVTRPIRDVPRFGKVQELREICLAVDSDTVVFEHNLSPAQQRNLEKISGERRSTARP